MTTPKSLNEPLDSDDEVGPVGTGKSDVERWIVDARGGCAASLGNLAERCRHYLLLVANRELDHDLRSKLGGSDLVQETLLSAHQVFARFTGSSEEELRFWLRQILSNKVKHASRSYRQAAKRDIHREQRPPEDSSGGDAWLSLADDGVTPGQNAIANEQAAAIEKAVGRLPENYQQVIRRRCFDRQSFVEIGRLLQISSEAARKLWCRAVDRLRHEWEASDESG